MTGMSTPMAVPVINQLKDAESKPKACLDNGIMIIPTDPITTSIGREKAEVARVPSDDSLRLDARLLEWFDYYLLDKGEKPVYGLKFKQPRAVALEDRYPPEGMTTLALDLGGL
ncbi:MAG: hypothetical protein Ct9H90mP14_3430 [Methanobacteriota archaeon]|nr:MAG: hypothetical protein Ct9H90mP14_3430 [Euryarchaeota archaeon]